MFLTTWPMWLLICYPTLAETSTCSPTTHWDMWPSGWHSTCMGSTCHHVATLSSLSIVSCTQWSPFIRTLTLYLFPKITSAGRSQTTFTSTKVTFCEHILVHIRLEFYLCSLFVQLKIVPNVIYQRGFFCGNNSVHKATPCGSTVIWSCSQSVCPHIDVEVGLKGTFPHRRARFVEVLIP